MSSLKKYFFLFFTLDDFLSDIKLIMMVDIPSFFNNLGFTLGLLKKEGLIYCQPPLKNLSFKPKNFVT